ncbi:hypothetical protein [Kitasatospora paranensis]|uniref:Uncharacterized protein n=1 Tax=Kitasatospora paranensis TaxID=258053 RepID=A0ABW2G0W7_9ACTN
MTGARDGRRARGRARVGQRLRGEPAKGQARDSAVDFCDDPQFGAVGRDAPEQIQHTVGIGVVHERGCCDLMQPREVVVVCYTQQGLPDATHAIHPNRHLPT